MSDASQLLPHDNNSKAKDTGEIVKKLENGDVHLVAGTSWLWCDPRMRGSVDVLVIDEAGQFSLADALAVSVAAKSLVLLGDPQQLAQPSKGSHPPGAEVSALKHLLGDRDTLERGKGLFLEQTWRLPPKLAGFTSQFFYGGELRAHPDCARRQVRASGSVARFSGSGLYFEPVEHTGNVNASEEEARRVAEIVSGFLESEARWVDRDGTDHALTPGHVLVVAPYNAQVQLICEHLSDVGHSSVEVGTVDKFQGRQAPVVVYSMATSSAEDAPRGFDFLYNLNRLNVATSRSQGVAIIVASERLLEAECKTPKQMRLVNALCGAFEHAAAGA